jgi:predicted nucleic acid-binding protein
MGVTVFDTSVLAAVLDGDDVHHDAAVAAYRDAGERVAPSSVYAALLVRPFRRAGGSDGTVDRFVDDTALRLVPIDRELAREAARLRAAHGAIRLPDAFVLACGELHRADRVVTADARWARVSPRVTVL